MSQDKLKDIRNRVEDAKKKTAEKPVSARGLYYHSDGNGTYDVQDMFDAVTILFEIINKLVDYIEHIKDTIPKCVIEALKDTDNYNNVNNPNIYGSTTGSLYSNKPQ